jgi:tRNA A58 N-methylase Trm61
VEEDPKRYQKRGSFSIPDHVQSDGSPVPVIAGSRLYLREENTLLCYDVRADALEGARPEPRVVQFAAPVPPKEKDVSATRPRTGKDRAPDAIFVPTPQDVVEKMLELAKVDKKDLVVDLGSGDGRVVITAGKKYGCKAIGYEIDPTLVKLSREAVQKEQLQERVRIEHEDIFTLDLSQTDVVAVYLPANLLQRLLPQLQKLKPGARIVSHYFEIPGIKPDSVTSIVSNEDGNPHKLYLWKCPLTPAK